MSNSERQNRNIAQEKKIAAQADEGVVTFRSVHEGPLPAPETLEYYNKVYPNATKEIFEMAREQQAHIIKIDTIGAETARTDVILSAIIGLVGQFGTVLVMLSGFIFAYLRPETGKYGMFYSSVVAGYLIWWKTKKAKE